MQQPTEKPLKVYLRERYGSSTQKLVQLTREEPTPESVMQQPSHLQHEVPKRMCETGEPEDQATCKDEGGVQNCGAREQGLFVSEHM